jgi:hypothetical protein
VALYGLMITREDHDVFDDWCRDQLGLYDAVVCLDGSDSPHTARIARSYRDRLIYLHERDHAIRHKTDHGLRAVAHGEIVRRFGRDTWIMCCHPDEFCYHDPRKIARLADAEGYDLVSWLAPLFYPHPSERGVAEGTAIRRPVADHFRHYHWSYHGDGFPWLEDQLYRAGAGVAWDGVTHGSVRPVGVERVAPFHPILRHYKVCDTDPSGFDLAGVSSHYRHHWPGQSGRTGVPFPVKRADDLYVAEVRDYRRCDRFDGIFPHDWNMGEEFRPGVSEGGFPTAGPPSRAAELAGETRGARAGRVDPSVRLSLIVAVYQSHEVVRRQILHLGRLLGPECELILVDDGSDPPLRPIVEALRPRFALTLIATEDRRPWTQPRARNLGAARARSERLLFFDIDHIVTAEVLEACLKSEEDKLHWIRQPGVLGLYGGIVTARDVLLAHGMTGDQPSVHANSFMIRAPLFAALGGYDEEFCGQYGGDDVDFNARYDRLCAAGGARQAAVSPALGYVFPNPARDVAGLFHSLSRTPEGTR